MATTYADDFVSKWPWVDVRAYQYSRRMPLAVGEASSCILANNLRARHNAAMLKLDADAGVANVDYNGLHAVAQVNSAEVTTYANAVTLCTNLRAKYQSGSLLSKLDADTQIVAADFVSTCTVAAAAPSSQATLNSCLNEMAQDMELMFSKLNADSSVVGIDYDALPIVYNYDKILSCDIQNAINDAYANGGGTVIIPPTASGIDLVDQYFNPQGIDLKPGVTIQGMGGSTLDSKITLRYRGVCTAPTTGVDGNPASEKAASAIRVCRNIASELPYTYVGIKNLSLELGERNGTTAGDGKDVTSIGITNGNTWTITCAAHGCVKGQNISIHNCQISGVAAGAVVQGTVDTVPTVNTFTFILTHSNESRSDAGVKLNAFKSYYGFGIYTTAARFLNFENIDMAVSGYNKVGIKSWTKREGVSSYYLGGLFYSTFRNIKLQGGTFWNNIAWITHGDDGAGYNGQMNACTFEAIQIIQFRTGMIIGPSLSNSYIGCTFQGTGLTQVILRGFAVKNTFYGCFFEGTCNGIAIECLNERDASTCDYYNEDYPYKFANSGGASGNNWMGCTFNSGAQVADLGAGDNRIYSGGEMIVKSTATSPMRGRVATEDDFRWRMRGDGLFQLGDGAGNYDVEIGRSSDGRLQLTSGKITGDVMKACVGKATTTTSNTASGSSVYVKNIDNNDLEFRLDNREAAFIKVHCVCTRTDSPVTYSVGIIKVFSVYHNGSRVYYDSVAGSTIMNKYPGSYGNGDIQLEYSTDNCGVKFKAWQDSGAGGNCVWRVWAELMRTGYVK